MVLKSWQRIEGSSGVAGIHWSKINISHQVALLLYYVTVGIYLLPVCAASKIYPAHRTKLFFNIIVPSKDWVWGCRGQTCVRPWRLAQKLEDL